MRLFFGYDMYIKGYFFIIFIKPYKKKSLTEIVPLSSIVLKEQNFQKSLTIEIATE